MSLNDQEKRVYALVRSAAQRGKRMTIGAVAEELGMARSSVAHVAVKLGYKGWVDLTTQLVTYFKSFEHEDVVSESVEVVASILRTNRELPVLVDAIGDAEVLIDYALFRLAEAGFIAMPYGSGVVDAVAASAGNVECNGETMPIGTLIVVNESGMSLLPSCVKATSFGMDVVAITASHDTPVSKVAKVNVVIKNNKSTPEAYEPNYFTAGALVFFEHVLAACDVRS